MMPRKAVMGRRSTVATCSALRIRQPAAIPTMTVLDDRLCARLHEQVHLPRWFHRSYRLVGVVEACGDDQTHFAPDAQVASADVRDLENLDLLHLLDFIYRENTPRYGVRVSHSLRQRLNDPIIPAIAKFLQKRHDVFLARLVVAINSGS